jgi:hypothetical protein
MFTHWNDIKLSISQWNWWKIEIMFWENNMKWVFLSETQWNRLKIDISFGKMIWNQVFLSETVGKSRLCFGKTIWNWVFDIKKSWFMIISIWIFIKRIAISNLNQYFIKNCHFHIVSYLIVSYQYQIVSYQFLVLILWSHPCLVWREKKYQSRAERGQMFILTHETRRQLVYGAWLESVMN